MNKARGRAVYADAAAAVAMAAALTAAVLVATQPNRDFGPHAGPTVEPFLNTPQFVLSRAVSAVVFGIAGWYLCTRRPGVLFGPLALAAALGDGLSVLGGQLAVYSEVGGHHLPGAGLALWVLWWGLGVEPFALVVILVLFPDGRLSGGALKWPGLVAIGLCAVGLLHGMVDRVDTDPSGPFARFSEPLGFWLLPGLNDVYLFLPGLLIGTAVLTVRWVRARGEAKRVLGPLAVVAILTVLPLPFGVLSAEAEMGGELFVILTLVAVVAGVLRHRVYGIEVVLNRTLVYAVLSGIVAAVYGVLVGVVNLLGANVNGGAGVIPAIVAAFALFPARQRVQRLVNRLLYGQRDEPYAVVSEIGVRLEGAGTADQLLPDLLDSIVTSLRLPYAAIEVRHDDGSIRRIESGVTTSDTDRFPLVHQGRSLGDLLVGWRSGQVTIPAGERALLGDIARQAAVAVSNVMLTEELLRSRERIVNAAEDERRRLRRDLHDGLGPVLTAAATRVDAARNLIPRDTDAADGLLGDVRRDLTAALDDLRRLVYALRPPALDELGLLGALREQATRASLPVVLRVPPSMPTLPPAVEVAAYRIISEAITNVCRHAGASSCRVLIECDEALRIDVQDDGPAPSEWSLGVGLSSMRERTMELGGTWEAGPARDGGGRVHVELPLASRHG